MALFQRCEICCAVPSRQDELSQPWSLTGHVIGHQWRIEGVWKAEEIERMAKALGGRQVVEKWEANVIEFLEMLLSNPSIMLASCLLPLVFSFKLMFRRSGQNLAQHLIIQLYCLGLVLVLTSLPLFGWGKNFEFALQIPAGLPEIPPKGLFGLFLLLLVCYARLFCRESKHFWRQDNPCHLPHFGCAGVDLSDFQLCLVCDDLREVVSPGCPILIQSSADLKPTEEPRIQLILRSCHEARVSFLPKLKGNPKS